MDKVELCSPKTTSAKVFGLCDDIAKEQQEFPAFLFTSNPQVWTATVQNPAGEDIEFRPIDKCLHFYRGGDRSKPESLCDALLHYQNNIILAELKDRKDNKWVAEGKEQISNTIRLLFEYPAKGNEFDLELGNYRRRRAFICNKKKPQFVVSTNEEKQAFKKANYGFSLEIQATITI